MIKTGFTLIELMIVVVIIAILSAIAYPSYTQYSKRAKRVEAQSVMLELSQKLIAYKIANGSFKDIGTSGLINSTIPVTGTGNYNLTITDIDGTPYSSTTKNGSWRLTATPINGMLNTGVLTLDSQGKQCWYKESLVCSPWEGK
ncbi:type IV pilin protein [Acinetobacter sp. YH12039]|uniref:type IV pilin protein n=1 Tax=Acinetobacter sp. YH12039 TaxID=2601047 RepID=UPI0015D402C3|nr:type IV pilin protein [Acinetobacter sp. YH12039]